MSEAVPGRSEAELPGSSPRAVAVGLGSMPGESPEAALSIICGEVPDVLHLPELPARGPGADLVGRTAALLTRIDKSFAIETTPSGWRQAPGMTAVMRSGLEWYRADCFALDLVAASADWVKLQFCGPVTLAAAVEAHLGERLLSDTGALNEFAAGIAQLVTSEIAELRQRLPRCEVVVQVDEPGLAAAVDGTIPTRSGRGRIRPLSIPTATRVEEVVAKAIRTANGEAWLHSCADRLPSEVATGSGYAAVSTPLSAVDRDVYERMAAYLESGNAWVVGLPGRTGARDVFQKFGEMGFSEEFVAHHTLVSHTCGLAFEVKPETVLRRLAGVAKDLRGAYEREEANG